MAMRKGKGAVGGGEGALEEAVEKIVIPAIQIGTIKLRLVGSTSLIVNNFSEKSRRQMLDDQMSTARRKKEPKDPVACYEGARYLDSKGQDCVKASAIKQSLVAAARFCEGLPMTILRQALFVKTGPTGTDHCLIEMEDPAVDRVMREDIVRVGKFPNKTADVRFRPEYHRWSVPVTIEYNSNILKPEHVVHLAALAGFHVGLHEWRPDKNGDHGRFTAEVDSGTVRKPTPSQKAA